ncbi:hypothetical protein ACTXG5_22885 [Mycobacterium sp. Dal123C01]|uniref:hypothetical protein n=1 Tax=Mycobacterium sp. Dal123C01 TaxID=3457577 RepID=UPI00403E5140
MTDRPTLEAQIRAARAALIEDADRTDKAITELPGITNSMAVARVRRELETAGLIHRFVWKRPRMRHSSRCWCRTATDPDVTQVPDDDDDDTDDDGRIIINPAERFACLVWENQHPYHATATYHPTEAEAHAARPTDGSKSTVVDRATKPRPRRWPNFGPR